jgi:hypothetical protein
MNQVLTTRNLPVLGNIFLFGKANDLVAGHRYNQDAITLCRLKDKLKFISPSFNAGVHERLNKLALK